MDIIKLLDDLFCRLRYGAGELIEWPAKASLTGADMEQLLRQRGVRVYGRQYARRPADNYGLHVPTAQARWARTIVQAALAGRPLPKPWGRGVGPVGLSGRIVDWLK